MHSPLNTLIQEAERCVNCGLCLPHCPTYRKTGSEADSPRGRIQLMRAVAQHVLPNNDRFKAHIDLCLACRSCENVCPNSVQYGQLIDTARAQLNPKKSWHYSLAKPLIRSPRLQRAIAYTLYGVQRLHLTPLLNRALPANTLLPSITQPQAWAAHYPAQNTKQGAVSLFLGCTNSLDAITLQASLFVLTQLGFDVHIPPAQTCCGGIARQQGDAAEAEQLLQQNQQAFRPDLPIITLASGCGAGLQSYLKTHTTQDIHHFLAQCDWRDTPLKPRNETIYVQDPCTLRNVQKNHSAVYQLLKKIPQANIQSLAGNAQCCGGAGIYMLNQPEMASQLLADKLNAIATQQVTTLATANIGCALHIAQGLRATRTQVNVLHPMRILAEQLGALL